MESHLQSFGANATVYIRYTGDITQLAKQLSQNLQLPEFIIETEQYPPHNYCGMSEVLGFETWLHTSNTTGDFNYIFSIETTDSFLEKNLNRMYNLSFWFARYISFECKFDTMLYDKQYDVKIQFHNGEII